MIRGPLSHPFSGLHGRPAHRASLRLHLSPQRRGRPRQLILWRLLTGLGASGVVPLALALMGHLFPYEPRGWPLGWLFGAMAGGMAVGSTFGALLEPFIGWRGGFLGVSALSAGALALLGPLIGRAADRWGPPWPPNTP